MRASPTPRDAFVQIALRAPDRSSAERAAAEAYAAGAVGLEERSDTETIDLVLYAPAAAADAVLAALAELPVAAGPPEALPAVDWAERWKVHHGPVRVSPRLVVRPPFGEAPRAAEARSVVIDPGAAFGTGSHESTRLALEWIDRLVSGLPAGARMLDVGAGTGVLCLAALALAPLRAVALDLDPLAGAATRDNARRNGLDARVQVFTGGLEALDPGLRFDLVAANLLRRELEPILPDLAQRTRPGAPVVLSGLLARERERIETLGRRCGLAVEGERLRTDASGERWSGLLMRRRRAAASPR